MMGRDKRTKLLWPLVIYAVLWTLWIERNRRIFGERGVLVQHFRFDLLLGGFMGFSA